jgi:hypothetical protein
MIAGLIHRGSGLGDQLFSYIATRVRAADLGLDFGFIGKEFFKGQGWMDLDWGKPVGLSYDVEEQSGKVVIFDPNNVIEKFELNTPYYNPEFNFIPINSVIDGYGAQDIRYFEHRLDEVREWLKTEPLKYEDNTIIINFRGGEYKAVPELYLPWEYWNKALNIIGKDKPIVEVNTDNISDAKEMFGNMFDYYSNIETNWQAIRYAKHLIISNSAFAILPALLNENVKEVIAPRYWAGRNVQEWRRPGNYYKKFTYI